ncbi:MAG: hypothetical protein A2504_09535 [Bdellovibrionales bacterium RIFOXYD12_FULL_39_22]|nr:MAG: hypothetical protein A2385_13025 [Bdellovibrionales bacterium RIFOXYB1_FULL_39_21]OFZ40968.1 MAG: hypothetical protein A2485_16535 [Bdellovibrionales bacterium RIFOXYC12_FULL_39_17]OFZ44796.1 MAG: hypothetical protein A2404_09825 [Bdellovibrionales bacterium RIFOXYC1_FULL_39_130]OFZ73589.1 MAG: hypothetical protein A2451_06435 [Bdellovibrionales bacterium RIFOXYC2_FULL_39_8]OFZ74261.1 MAG: hypothetical protein A2560_16790 [Bdellovibrionales bacterium RIFOXYD1_FULL_39_84]OFZ92125.1 MAG:
MKLLIFCLTLALTSIGFASTSAGDLKTAATYVDGQNVVLEGSYAKIFRANNNDDDREIIAKCGEKYDAFILNTPINVSVTSMEGDATTTVSVHRLSLHQAIVDKGLTRVSGELFQITAGLCNSEAFGIAGNR